MKKCAFLSCLIIVALILGGCRAKQEMPMGEGGGVLLEAPVGQTEQTTENTPDDKTPDEQEPVTQSSDKTPDKTPQNQTPQQENSNQQQQPSNSNQNSQSAVAGMVDLSKDVRFFGRTYEENGTYFINWTESGFEFTFNGTGAEATFETNETEYPHTPYIRIYVDGKEPGTTVAITDSMQTVTLCSGLKKGTHTVRVVKRTNARSSSLGVMDITLLRNGVIQSPPAAKERRIEFIGDSLTVGYGSLGSSSTKEWSTSTEDGSITYAALAAKALGADYNVIAISGRGLAHNTDGDTDKLMPALYPMLDEYNNPGVKWDFSKFTPHVIVINLGTNDQNTSSEAEVTAATIAFLKNIRANNPNAHIIVTYCLGGNKMEGAIKSAVSGVGDTKISYLALPTATETVVGHPAKSSHQKAAIVLEAQIRKVTGWK